MRHDRVKSHVLAQHKARAKMIAAYNDNLIFIDQLRALGFDKIAERIEANNAGLDEALIVTNEFVQEFVEEHREELAAEGN